MAEQQVGDDWAVWADDQNRAQGLSDPNIWLPSHEMAHSHWRVGKDDGGEIELLFRIAFRRSAFSGKYRPAERYPKMLGIARLIQSALKPFVSIRKI